MLFMESVKPIVTFYGGIPMTRCNIGAEEEFEVLMSIRQKFQLEFEPNEAGYIVFTHYR